MGAYYNLTKKEKFIMASKRQEELPSSIPWFFEGNQEIRVRGDERPPPPPPPKPHPTQPGFFDPFLLAIPDWMLPSRDGWYGRMWG